MPRAKAKSAPGLAIELHDDRKFYTPGSTVAGQVLLITLQDFAIGSVTIEFYGRVKVHFVQSHGHGDVVYRGRAPLFSQKQLLFQGYHTHKPSSFNWPFAFDLPSRPDLASVQQAKHQWKSREHFLATDDYISRHPMPPSFRMRKFGFGYRWHAFVEYVIHVEIREAEGSSMILPPHSRKASLPILVRHVSRPDSNTLNLPLEMQFTLPDHSIGKVRSKTVEFKSNKFKVQTSRHVIRSKKLEDWNRESNLPGSSMSFSHSIRDKTKSIFNASSLPRYAFDVNVTIPEEVRLLQQGGFPIYIDAVPVMSDEHTTIQSQHYPNIRIERITLRVCANTHIRFRGVLQSSGRSRYDIDLLNRHPINHTIDVGFPGQFSSNKDRQTESQASDISHAKGFEIHRAPGVAPALTSAKLGRLLEKPLATSFSTYIIAREYELKYIIELEVAGEKIRVTNDADTIIKVLPPTAENLHAILQDEDATKAEIEIDQDTNESESEINAASSEKKGLFESRTARRTKSREPANTNTKTAAATASAVAGPSSGDELLVRFESGEALPNYQTLPRMFGYRHEIDERPPRYEPE